MMFSRPLVIAWAFWLMTVPAFAQDPAAERLYRAAQRLSQQGDIEAALEEFELLLRQFPRDQLAPTALLDRVRLSRMGGDVESARTDLDRLLADYPRSVEAASGFVLQAELELDEARDPAALEEARKTFRRVPLLYGRERYPVLPDRTMARIRSGEISLRLGDPATAVAEILTAIEDEPPSLWTGRAHLALGDAFLAAGDWLAAAEILQSLASESEPTEESGRDGAALHLKPAAMTAPTDIRLAAARRLRFIDRHHLRPAAGIRRWTETVRFPGGGLALESPSGVAAAEDGRVVIVDRRARMIAAVAADGTVLDRKAIEDPRKPSWPDEPWPYLATETHVVKPFDGGRAAFSDPRPDRDAPIKDLMAAERNAFGEWYVLSDDKKGVLVYDLQRRGSEILAQDRPQFEDLARDSQGRVYVLDRKAKTVTLLGSDRRPEIVVRGPSWKRAVALDVDRAGNIYVLDRGNKRIEVFDAGGRPLTSLGPSMGGGIELGNPVDIAVDGTGRLFVADEKLSFVVMLE